MEYYNCVDFKDFQKSEVMQSLVKNHNTVITVEPADYDEEEIQCVIKMGFEKVYVVVFKQSLYDSMATKIIEENTKHKNV